MCVCGCALPARLQAITISSLAHSNFGIPLQAVAALQPYADMSMLVAVASFSLGITGEQRLAMP